MLLKKLLDQYEVVPPRIILNEVSLYGVGGFEAVTVEGVAESNSFLRLRGTINEMEKMTKAHIASLCGKELFSQCTPEEIEKHIYPAAALEVLEYLLDRYRIDNPNTSQPTIFQGVSYTGKSRTFSTEKFFKQGIDINLNNFNLLINPEILDKILVNREEFWKGIRDKRDQDKVTLNSVPYLYNCTSGFLSKNPTPTYIVVTSDRFDEVGGRDVEGNADRVVQKILYEELLRRKNLLLPQYLRAPEGSAKKFDIQNDIRRTDFFIRILPAVKATFVTPLFSNETEESFKRKKSVDPTKKEVDPNVRKVNDRLVQESRIRLQEAINVASNIYSNL